MDKKKRRSQNLSKNDAIVLLAEQISRQQEAVMLFLKIQICRKQNIFLLQFIYIQFQLMKLDFQ